MNVEFVPRHMDNAPLLVERADSASKRECEFFNRSCFGSAEEGGGVAESGCM